MNYDVVTKDNRISNYGKVICLLGTAESGPSQELVRIPTREVMADTFGSTGSLIDAFNHLSDIADSTQVEVQCMKITGQHAKLSLDVNPQNAAPIPSAFVLESKYSDPVYNNIYLSLDTEGMTFYFPILLGGGSKRYQYADYQIVGLLLRAINADTQAGINHVWCKTIISHGTPLDALFYPVNANTNQFSGASSGLNPTKIDIWFSLNEAYDLLESVPVDIVLPLDAKMDDVHPRFHYGDEFSSVGLYSADRDYLDAEREDGTPLTYHRPLIDFCKKQTRFGLITHGIMGFNEIQDIEELTIQAYNYLDVVNASPLGDRIGFVKAPETDDGFFISVVAGDLLHSDGKIANGSPAYAGLMARTITASSLTNKPLGDSVSMASVFSTEQLEILSGFGVTSFRDSVLNGLVVSNAVTPTEDTQNELHYSCNVRMIQLVLSRLRMVFDEFIGRNINDLVEADLLDQTVRKVLEQCKTEDILKDYSFTTDVDWKNGWITVDLGLRTLFMLETFHTSAVAALGT